MSIFPDWLNIEMGECDGVTVIDLVEIEVLDDSIEIEMESILEVDILDDSITVEICDGCY
jgi:hypothetical protein